MAYDKCGTKVKTGGDTFTVELVGPLHTHANAIVLSVNDGITDLGDGSYLVTIALETAGYYKVYIYLDGVKVDDSGFKTSCGYFGW